MVRYIAPYLHGRAIHLEDSVAATGQSKWWAWVGPARLSAI